MSKIHLGVIGFVDEFVIKVVEFEQFIDNSLGGSKN